MPILIYLIQCNNIKIYRKHYPVENNTTQFFLVTMLMNYKCDSFLIPKVALLISITYINLIITRIYLRQLEHEQEERETGKRVHKYISTFWKMLKN